ncbi:hypothetical protein [Neisseria sp. HMSC70E02]|jgi:hypothetical protein|uniref:hypothetical protein n=1 Tax=Neisseria sp. HMSC70E02 TaxID=1608896 RepID=UPI0008A9A99F|nr:hypothetical protein [Neisseria sp. HMSC70E02]OHR72042.1 hypothetical protein HMPREF3277_11920 [Neisseria sp. HMSC70E02]
MARNRRHQFDNLSDVGDKLDLDNPTVENIVDILVHIGNLDQVYTFHDDFLGLKDDLPQELLSQNVHELDDDTLDKYSDAVSEILDNANEIFYHLEREHSESDLEEIQEERKRLGLDND